MTELKQRLKQILIEGLQLEDIKPEDLQDNTPLFGEGGLGLDSLDAVELVVLIQKNFQVEIPNMEEGMKAFQNIESLANYIERKRNGG